MTPAQASAVIAHAVAFTRLYDGFIRLAPTMETIAAFRDSTSTLHDLLRSDPKLREALGAFETWMQAHDHAQGRGPLPPAARPPAR